MTPEQAAQLRAPFPPEQVGVLPKPTKKENPKGNCDVCGGYHGLPAIHLDYIGHAATTDRLLQVDPDWSWEPMAVGPNGEPLMTDGGLWIKLTVAGVTRPGFGDGANPKEIIGDAIRNAAMRFGVALDLWAKEPLSAEDRQPGPARQKPAETPVALPDESDKVTKAQHAKIGVLVKEWMDWTGPESEADPVAASRQFCVDRFGKHSRAELTKAEAGQLIAWLDEQIVLARVPFG